MTKYVFFFEIAKLLLIEKRVQAQAVLREKKIYRRQNREIEETGYYKPPLTQGDKQTTTPKLS
jgi:hypothetical protein